MSGYSFVGELLVFIGILSAQAHCLLEGNLAGHVSVQHIVGTRLVGDYVGGDIALEQFLVNCGGILHNSHRKWSLLAQSFFDPTQCFV